jgi:hypothetical protein
VARNPKGARPHRALGARGARGLISSRWRSGPGM